MGVGVVGGCVRAGGEGEGEWAARRPRQRRGQAGSATRSWSDQVSRTTLAGRGTRLRWTRRDECAVGRPRRVPGAGAQRGRQEARGTPVGCRRAAGPQVRPPTTRTGKGPGTRLLVLESEEEDLLHEGQARVDAVLLDVSEVALVVGNLVPLPCGRDGGGTRGAGRALRVGQVGRRRRVRRRRRRRGG